MAETNSNFLCAVHCNQANVLDYLQWLLIHKLHALHAYVVTCAYGYIVVKSGLQPHGISLSMQKDK